MSYPGSAEAEDSHVKAALGLLRLDAVPEIEVVEDMDRRFPELSVQRRSQLKHPDVNAFRLLSDGGPSKIFIAAAGAIYRACQRGRPHAIYLLAAAIAHEVEHGRGGDELAAVVVERDYIRDFIAKGQLVGDSGFDPLVYLAFLEGRICELKRASGKRAARPVKPVQ